MDSVRIDETFKVIYENSYVSKIGFKENAGRLASSQ